MPPPPLPEPSTDQGRAGLDALLVAPERAVMGLDFDGTLAPIVPDPDDARAHPAAAGALAALAGRLGRLAIITGRPAQLAVDYGGLGDVRALVVLGHYGLERWAEGVIEAPEPDPAVEDVRRRLPPLLERLGAPEGTYVEDKGRALAVHLRRTADPEAAQALVAGPLAALAREAGLVVEPGRMVIELRPAGADKGGALRALTEEGTQAGPASVVVFVGDDLGDLAAFDEVDRQRASGIPGLLVCSGSTEVTVLAKRADLVVDGPDGVVGLLHALVQAMAPTGPPV